MDHSGMDHSGGSSTTDDTTNTSGHGAGGVMPVVFQWVLSSPLYSYAFTPRNGGQYFGAIIFLIALAIIYRGVTAFRAYKEQIWRVTEQNRKIIIAGQLDDKASAELSTRDPRRVAPWRWQVDAIRASLAFVSHGLEYLLMLAVMSLNVGYFFAVLIGIFIGELTFGRYGH